LKQLLVMVLTIPPLLMKGEEEEVAEGVAQEVWVTVVVVVVRRGFTDPLFH
jgi:hypothetical protein